MGIHKSSVVLTDSDDTALSAIPAVRRKGAATQLACVSVTTEAHFPDGTQVCNSGTTRSVMVPPDKELATLAHLGDKLRGQHEETGDVTVVTTAKALCDKLMSDFGITANAAAKFVAELLFAADYREWPVIAEELLKLIEPAEPTE